MASRWARTLTLEDSNPQLDMAAYVGQRRATYRFELVDAVTGYRQEINPVRSTAPTLSHDTSRTIKRQISGLFLGVDDTMAFNSITSRLDLSMVIDGVAYPMGRYMPNGQSELESTAGSQSVATFYDEGFIVDQQFSAGFSSLLSGEPIQTTLNRCLTGLPIDFTIAPSPFGGTLSWRAGTRRGYAVEQMAIDGDWFSPWFDNTNVMRFIRTFDPATAIPTFDLDSGNQVLRDRIIRSNDLISAPNRFVVVSNGVSAVGSNSAPVYGVYNVPDSAPHSALNRGFVITETEERQLFNSPQAQAVAQNLGQRQIIFETIELQTVPDPRHDSYDVLRWRGVNWLETSWSLQLTEGAPMQHTARRAYL